MADTLAEEMAELDTGRVPPPIRPLTADERFEADLVEIRDEPLPPKTNVRSAPPVRQSAHKQLADILARDAVLAEQYLDAKSKRLSEAMEQREASKAEIMPSVLADIAVVQKRAEESAAEIDTAESWWPQNKPQRSGGIMGFFSRQLSKIGLSRFDGKLSQYNHEWAVWKEEAADARGRIEAKLRDDTSNIYWSRIGGIDRDIKDLKFQAQQLPAQVNEWLEQGRKRAAQIEPNAQALDARKLYAFVQAKFDNGEPLTEAAWDFYRRDSRIVADIVGFDAARALGITTEYAQKNEARAASGKFLKDLDGQMPENVWELKQARKRLKQVVDETASEGFATEGRDLREEMLRTWERLKKEAEEKAKAEKAEKEKAEREANLKAQMKPVMRARSAEEILLSEITKLCEEWEANLASARAANPARGRGRERAPRGFER